MPIYLVMLVPLYFMAVSDWKNRTVSIWWLALLFLLTLSYSFLKSGAYLTAIKTGQNIAIILILGLGLYLYSLLRNKKLRELGGLGDLLFFIALTPLFQLEEFIQVTIIMLISSLILWSLLKAKHKLESIPLVTFCSVPLMIWLFLR